MKIRTRLILSFTLLVGVGFYFLVDFILDGLRPRYLEAVEEVLVDQAQILAGIAETQIKDGRIDAVLFREALKKVQSQKFSAKIYQMNKTQVDERIFLVDKAGIVLFDSKGQDEGRDYSQWRDIYLTLRGEYGARTTRGDVNNPTTSVLHVSAPIRWNGAIVGVATVAKPTASINFFIETARPTIIIAGTVAALSAILLAVLLSLWITRPIGKLTAYARRIRDQKPTRLPALGSSEIAEMGQAFEEMREALEGKKYVEQYVQNLTHELKSPLAAVQGAAELLNEQMPAPEREKFLNNIRSENKRMQALVDRMLQLASLEAQKELRDTEAISVQAMIQACIDRSQALLNAKRLSLENRPGQDFTVPGERFLLESALYNLLLNAMEFSPSGGRIQISSREAEGVVQIVIDDQGAGIPEYALSKIFEKFFSLPRPDHGKKSSGLGLSFAGEVASLHGGGVTVANREGGGVQAVLSLPRS